MNIYLALRLTTAVPQIKIRCDANDAKGEPTAKKNNKSFPSVVSRYIR